MNNTTKPFVETFLVAKEGTTLQAVNTKFSNDTDSAITVNAIQYQPSDVILETGQIGIYDAKTNTAIDSTATVTKASSIYLAQKRDESTDSGTLPTRKVEKSNNITPVNGVTFIGNGCAVPLNSTWTIKNVNVSDETEYEINLGVNGRRADIFNGRTTGVIGGTFTTPDYSALSYTLVNSRDHLLQNIAYDLLLNGRKPYELSAKNPLLVFAFDTTGTSTSTTTAADLVSGASILLGTTQAGTPITIRITDSMAATFAKLIADGELIGTTKLVPLNLDTAGTGVSTVDNLVIVANDGQRFFRDNIKQIKNRLVLALPKGFNSTVVTNEAVPPFEGKGLGHVWQMNYEATASLQKYSSELERFDGTWVGYNSDILPGTYYSAYVIEHNATVKPSNGTLSYAPMRTILLVPCCNETLKNSIEAVLNPYFASSMHSAFEGELNASGQVEVTTCPTGTN